MRRVSVLMGRNFSPARKVLSITLPSAVRRSLVRTNAPPLPGFTCWNSRILKTVPSTSMWVPFLNWLVEIMRPASLAARSPGIGDPDRRLSLAREGLRPGDSDHPVAVRLEQGLALGVV